MTSLSQREQVMVVVLPAAVLLLIYLFFFASPKQDEIKELNRQLSVFQSRPDPRPELSRTQSDIFSTRKEIEKRKEVLGEQTRKQGALSLRWFDPATRSNGSEFFSKALDASGVLLVKEEKVSDQALVNQMIADPALRDQVWEVKVAGDFNQIGTLLQLMGNTTLPLAPLSLEMEERVKIDSNIHLWRLWIVR